MSTYEWYDQRFIRKNMKQWLLGLPNKSLTSKHKHVPKTNDLRHLFETYII